VNNSDLPTTFQFFTDKHNLFSFSQTQGTVKPHTFSRIIVTFNPQKTGNYYERVFCMVRNHSVLYVDLMGTCFDILTKPVPLSQRHVDVYRNKVIMGAHTKDVHIKENHERDGSMLESVDLDHDQEIPIDDPSQVVLHKEMLLSSASDRRDIHFSSDIVEFGFTEHGRLSESKQLSLENKFGFPVKVEWTLLTVLDETSGKWVKNPFNVTPAIMEIPAKSQAVFNVDFAPYGPDSYFFQLAQCFVTLLNGNQGKTKKLMTTGNFGTSQRTMKSAKTQTKTLLGSKSKSKYLDFTNEEVDPPVCSVIRFSGHSFAPGSQPFIPMIKMSTKKVAF